MTQLWARLEILRRESFHAEFARNRRGASMLRFVSSLESGHMRLVDRGWQRAIGESLILEGSVGWQIRSFRDFVDEYETSERLRNWFEPLAEMLQQTESKKIRQRFLRYGVVLHAMIDTLDKKHYTTRNRPGYPNKLSKRSKRDLVGRVFGVYLREVKNTEKYVGGGR
jgi:hypothetical protein